MFNRILVLFVLVISFSFQVVSQSTYTMKDTTVKDCDGILTDTESLFTSGGFGYSSNEDFTFRICPGSGATINFLFSFLSLEQGSDTIFFFNGPSITSPLLAFYTGTHTTLPPTIIANSGCLTIRFVSDGTLQLLGWNATWNTLAPIVAPPILNVNSIEPPACDSISFLIEFDKKIHCDSIINSTVVLTGHNAPTVTSLTKLGCNNDSSKFARVWLNTPFVNNCEYIINMNINIPDICDSIYNFDIKDTFDFVTCDLITNLTTTHDSLCFGDCSDLEISNVVSCNTYSYSWSNGLPSTTGPHSVCPLVTTTYTVTVTESNSGKQFIDSVTIKVLDTLDKTVDIFTNTSEPPECNERFFKVRFDKSIPCYFIDSGKFTITSAAGNFNVTKVTPLNCINGKMDSVRIRVNQKFSQNCEYHLEFDLNFIDSCEGPISINTRDTFLITDCAFTLNSVYNDTICINTCTNLTTTASGCDGYNYSWSNGLPNSVGPFNICPTGDTTIYVTVTEISTGLILIDTIIITVIDPTITSVNPLCTYNSPINLTAQTMGGIWSGNGITNPTLGTFDPSIASGGIHLITYNFNSCIDTILISVTNPNAGPNRNLCASGIPVNLFAATPAGGTWTGTNVNSGTAQFTPTVYGNYTAYYTINGCVDSINILADTISLNYRTDTVCGNSPPISIPFSPLGGIWSGPGIISTNSGIFDPSVSSNGSNLVNYFYKGCRDTVNMVVVTVNAGSDTNACPLQAPFDLSPASPINGDWSGTGITNITNGTFDPATSPGNWTSNLVYTFKGCHDTITMDVIQTNIVQDSLYFCPSQDSVLLHSIPGLIINPNNGNWSGNGITNYGSNTYLYPSFLGNGFHTIFYDKNTCQDSVIIGIYPDSLSYTDTTVCNSQAAFMLDPTNNFSGAIWQGTGITNALTGLFDPSLATLGVNVISYKTQGGICDKTINVTVYAFTTDNISIADTLCFINQDITIPVSPTGGTWGGSGNYNQIAGIFNSAIAGAGSHQITYSFGSGVCLITDTASVIVRDSISVTLSASPDTICLEENSTLSVVASGGNPMPNYTYSWSHSAINTNTDVVSPLTSTQYTVTVNDGCSDPNSDTTNITLVSIVPNLITSTPVCFGETGYATYDLSQQSVYNFTWINENTTNDTVFGIGGDTVYLRVSNAFGCFIDTFMIIPNYKFIKADFNLSPDIYPRCLSLEDKTITVIDKSVGTTTGEWDFGDGNTLPYSPSNTETNTYDESLNYTISLIVQNNGPCFDTLTKEICVSGQIFFIADIFSPNGDGVNDILFVRSNEAEELNFRVFDRWGQMIFESTDVSQGWDGKYKGRKLEAGVYFWYVNMKLFSGEELNEKGDVTLKR